MTTLVIAKYEENTKWSEGLKHKTFVVEKGVHLPNEGREPTSYLWYIIENYDTLKGKYFFLQGNPFDHCPHTLEELNNTKGEFRWIGPEYICNMMGRPQDTVNIKEFLDDCNVIYGGNSIRFNAACFFMLSARRIKKHTKEQYKVIYKALLKNAKSPYAFERCVEILWGK